MGTKNFAPFEDDRSMTDWTWKRFVSGAIMVLILIIAAGFGGWSIKNDKFIFTRDKTLNAAINTPEEVADIPIQSVKESVPLLQNLSLIHI